MMDSRLFLNTSSSTIPLCGNNLANSIAHPTNQCSLRNQNGPVNSGRMRDRNDMRNETSLGHSLLRKYVLLCLICGGVSLLVGSLYIVIFFLLRSYTTSLQYFETIPTYVPALVLIINGLIVMCFARRKSRYAYLIKFAGICSMICAILCVVITVTTTVIHMNRLQTLQECAYTPKSKTCTCISSPNSGSDSNFQSPENNGSHHLTFHNTPNCEVIHVNLYACLRALFGLSVFGILICIFCSMLVYQLLGHEKKKLYMEQLEIRRRFQHHNRRLQPHLPPPPLAPHFHSHISRNPQICNCVDDNLYPTGWPMPPPPPPWDVLDYRSYYRSFEDDSPQNVGASQSNRAHSWANWINWPWNNNNNNNSNYGTLNSNGNINRNDGILTRLFRRNRNSTDESHRANNNSLQWRPLNGPIILPPHVFIPRLGSGGLSTLPINFSRFRNANPYNIRGRTLSSMNTANRRTRSNDGIFHHLHLSPHSGYTTSALPPPSVFALWGPPPPYTCSQPPSLDRLNVICNNHDRRSNGRRRESNTRTGDTNPPSKLSTPLSERHHQRFINSSDGITLTIGSDRNTIVPRKSSCTVEIHVPYDDDHYNHYNPNEPNDDIHGNILKNGHSFNTLPHVKRNDQLHQFNPFKSLSNIPMNFPNRVKCDISAFPSHIDVQPTIISTEYPKFTTIQNVYPSNVPFSNAKVYIASPITTQSISITESEEFCSSQNANTSSPTESFPIDPPTDYKSTLIIATNTQSSPITDKILCNGNENNVIDDDLGQSKINYAQSMPNLSCVIPASASNTPSHSNPQFWDIHRIPSSGNTSTSQDYADFEFELDEVPLKFVNDLSQDITDESPSKSLSLKKINDSSSDMNSSTPEFLQPPTPFNTNHDILESENSTTISSPSEQKPDNIIITIKSIQV